MSTWKVDLIHGNLAAILMIFGLGRASNSSVNKDTPPQKKNVEEVLWGRVCMCQLPTHILSNPSPPINLTSSQLPRMELVLLVFQLGLILHLLAMAHVHGTPH